MTDTFGQPDIVGEIQAEKAYGPIYSAQYGDAMKSARANELGHRLGLPPEIVDSDIPNMMARDRLQRAVAAAQQNATYARMMQSPRLAASAIDDEHLPKVASAIDEHKVITDYGPALPGVLVGRLLSGVADVFSSFSGAAHAFDETHPNIVSSTISGAASAGPVGAVLPMAMRLFGKAHDAITAAGDATRYVSGNRNIDDVLSGVESLPSNAAALAATGYAGPLGGSAFFGLQAFGQSYEEGRKEGLDPSSAAKYGAGDAAVMAGTMFLPEKYLGGALKGQGGAAKALGSGLGLNAVATGLQGFNHWYWLERPKGVTFQQFLGELPDEERSAIVQTATALGITAGVGHIVGKVVNAQADEQAAHGVNNVMEAAAQSSTRTSNPSDFEAALNQIVGDGPSGDLYVPADKVLELFQPQEGKPQRNLRDDPFWSQYAPQVEEAATLGGDVVLPLPSVATHLAGSSDWNAIRDFVRARPGGASLAEVREAQSPEAMESMAAQVAQHLDEKVPQLKAAALTKDFAAKLGYKGEQADAVSQLLGAGLSRAYALEVARHEASGEPVPSIEDFAADYLPQAEKTTQAAYDAKRAATEGVTSEAAQALNQTVETPEFKGWFGDSKAVDESGKPLVVYHGSPDARFLQEDGTFKSPAERFGIGDESGVHWFTKDRSVAGTYADARRAFDYQGAEPDVVPAYLKLKNPLVIDAQGKAWREAQQRGKTRDLIDQAREAGHDGVIIKNVRDDYSSYEGNRTGKETDTYAVFDSKQIKSVDNVGTFAPNDPNIFHDTQRRGNISIARDEHGMMTNAVIRAFEHADFSTAVHESGHFFLEDLKRRALGEGATDQEKADWEAVKQWMGETGHQIEGEAIPEAAHEQWARGFERYIFEGKAPSQGLKAAFARMRDFMVSLYRSIRSFNAPITPEIRQVMDRLLASDDEIAARREELRLGDQALHELMTGDEQQRYAELGDEARSEARDKLFDRVLSTLRAERTREVAHRKAEIRQEIADEADKQPIFRALKMLRSGVPQEDGTTARIALPRQWLIDNYGEDILSKIPHDPQFRVADGEHAVDPEAFAQSAGFDSADQMVQKLIAHEEERQNLKGSGDGRSPRRALIESMTEQRLRSEIGDPLANLEEEADAALANEKQADRLSLELRALSRKSGGKAPVPWKLANDFARAHIRAASSKEAISGSAIQMYSRNAAKAAQRVEEALAAQDYEAAFRAKQQQVFNLALMAQAKAAKDDVMTAVKRLRKVAKARNIPSVDQDYLDQAHQLLESVDMKNRPAKAVDKRLAFEAWHAKQVEQEIEPVVPPEYRALLGQTHWSRLSINDLLDLDKAVKQIVKLGRLKKELKDGQKKRDFDEAVTEMGDSGGRVPPRKLHGKTTDPRKSLPGRAASILRSVDAAMIKAEQIAAWLDGGDPNGPWSRFLFRPLADAQGRETDLMRVYTKEINALVKAMPKAALRSLTRMVDTPELVIRNANHLSNGEAWSGTKDQVLMMALNWGNLGNRQRLLDGFGWSEDSVASVFDRVMTKHDWDFVQGVWDTVEKLWPDVAKLEREVNGVEPEKVEATEVPTPHGTYRGGYFPAIYDPTQSTRAALAEEDRIAPSGGWFTATTRSSATKNRVEQVKGRPLLLSMSVVTRHLGEVIHDITHRQAVSQAKRLLSDSRVHGIITTRLGPEYAKALGGWIENIARPGSSYSKSNPAGVAIGRYLNKGISLVGLGFRATTALVQVLGIPIAGKELGAKYLGQGIATVTAHPLKAYGEMVSRSAEMRARADTLDATIDDMMHEHASGKLKSIGPKGLEKYAFKGIAWMDLVTTTTVWTGAFNKGLAEGMSEQEAALYGDKMVRTTQGTGGMKDRSAIQNEHPLVRALYPFFSYMNALYNMQRDVVRQAVHAESASDVAEAARQGWWVFIAPMLLQSLLFGDGPQPGDDGEVTAGDWAAYLAKSLVLGNLGSIPLIGNIASAIGNGYSYRSSAYQQIGEGLVRGYKDIARTVEGEPMKGPAVQSALTTAGIITAKPLGQIGATTRGIYDYETGAADPQSIGDWYYLLTRGSIPTAPTAAERIAGKH